MTTQETSRAKIEELAERFEGLKDEMLAAFRSVCEAEGRALDPADLGVPEELREGFFDWAAEVEEIAAHRGCTFGEAVDFY